MRPGTLALALLLATTPAAVAQEHAPEVPAAETEAALAEPAGPAEGLAPEQVDIIMPHITDASYIYVPCLDAEHGFACHLDLPHWDPIHIGPLTLDLSPTRHVVFLFLAAILTAAVLITTAQAHKKHHHAAGRPRGFAAGMEAVVLYLRNEIILPNVGHHGDRYVPFCLTLFFFILFANMLGLVPYGATATGNISVTATLAIITFFVIEIAGMRALGWGYLGTIFYWNKELALPMRLLMLVIMSPVELIGKFTKPFALAIRLFANMTAGHVVILALVGFIFTFGLLFAAAPVLMAVAVMLLEIFVAFLQAFIFTLLAAVFIGQIRTAHH